MNGAWERRRILIWGKTRPEVSQNYMETVCTGGVFEDTGGLVRLYPIPLRYLDDEHYFKKYQWITAEVQRASDRDNRPESYRIRAEDIQVGETIGTGKSRDWRERRGWILRRQNIVPSVEELQRRQATDHTSLGILKPKKIIQITADHLPDRERQEQWKKYKEITSQLSLPADDVRQVKPLTPPDYKFYIRFKCGDPKLDCVHKFGILDWEVDALYFNMKSKYPEAIAKQKVIEHLEKNLMAENSDAHFFLGNISYHPQNFTIVCLFYPQKSPASLFDGVDDQP